MTGAHGIARDCDLALVLDEAERGVERDAVTDIDGGFRHSAARYLLDAAFEVVVSGVERVVHPPACGESELFRIQIDDDGDHLVIERELRQNEPQSACADDDDEVALVNLEAVEHIVAECDVFGKNRLVVGDAIGQGVDILRGNGDKVREQPVAVNAEHADLFHAVLLVSDIGADDGAGTHFEPESVAILGHIRHRGMSGNGELGVFVGSIGGKIRKIGGRDCHLRHLEFDLALVFAEHALHELDAREVLYMPGFHSALQTALPPVNSITPQAF